MGIRVTAYIGDWIGSPSFDTSFILWSNCLLCKVKNTHHNISCLVGLFCYGFFFYLIHNLSLRKLIYELNKKNDTFFKSSTPTKKQQQKSNNKKAKSFEKYLPILKISNIPLVLNFCLFPLPKLMKEGSCVQNNKR